ncbi:putative HTH La-type RNA-binding protein C1527,03 [Talaromyces islandicus]|uniref:Putative HTH La-type RNA-binding protein C1527,03 n=1 Tax=Talaromyces islandicus TaxID=28573 RepID=A0A0U1LRW5_TALIS|nr:putative HTH La-type RNA-binding protein C1527,03 [Talaromyces islandicus]
MAATASKTEMPTFSYAQAAKGLATSNTSQQSPKVPTEQVTETAPEDESSKGSLSTQTSNTIVAETSGDSEKPDSIVDPESKSTTTGSSKNVVSNTSSPSIGTASTSTLAKEDDIPAIPNGTSDSTWDKQSQTSTPADKAASVTDSKDGSTKSEKAAQKELKAAPIPAVNIWQQRKEAQEAKAKATAAVLKSTAPANKTASSKLAPQTNGDYSDSAKTTNKKKTANDGQADVSGSLGKDRKRTETRKSHEEGSKKSGNRTARPNDEASLPPVADATAWPTPQTALGDEKRKVVEKGDKAEKIEKTPSTRGKEKWTPVHYVPTAVFNTPLPSGARRGGRPSRGGREGGRGAHTSNNIATADSKTAAAQTSQPPVKHANAPERGRNESNSSRANSLPAQGRKPANAEANAQSDQKRPQHTVDRQRVDSRQKASEDAHSTPNGTSNSADATSKPHRENRLAKAPEFTPSQNARPGNAPSDGQANRHPSTHERRFDGPAREANGFVPREREHREFNRDKGDFQREHPKERGDSRPERGRGGYRGRGGHSYGAGSQNQHFQNSQHPFVPSNKSFGPNDRQRSQQQNFQNGTQPQHANHRLPLRSPSVPNSAGVYGTFPLPEINTVYPNYQNVPSGPMTAIPYQPYMEPFGLMSLIQLQLEYYFSVDNLCKDLYLRKHMDSQGFVRLAFIASFKRIKNLTEDYELLRHSSRQLKNADYQFSEDGQDRLRPRDKWEQWVLPLDQRDPSAQNDGYLPAQFHPEADRHVDNIAAPLTNGFGQHGSQTPPNGIPNGNHDYAASRTTLSTNAPEFTPFVPGVPQNEILNVGRFPQGTHTAHV